MRVCIEVINAEGKWGYSLNGLMKALGYTTSEGAKSAAKGSLGFNPGRMKWTQIDGWTYRAFVNAPEPISYRPTHWNDENNLKKD